MGQVMMHLRRRYPSLSVSPEKVLRAGRDMARRDQTVTTLTKVHVGHIFFLAFSFITRRPRLDLGANFDVGLT
jgi:hypothetical protein